MWSFGPIAKFNNVLLDCMLLRCTRPGLVVLNTTCNTLNILLSFSSYQQINQFKYINKCPNLWILHNWARVQPCVGLGGHKPTQSEWLYYRHKYSSEMISAHETWDQRCIYNFVQSKFKRPCHNHLILDETRSRQRTPVYE